MLHFLLIPLPLCVIFAFLAPVCVVFHFACLRLAFSRRCRNFGCSRLGHTNHAPAFLDDNVRGYILVLFIRVYRPESLIGVNLLVDVRRTSTIEQVT